MLCISHQISFGCEIKKTEMVRACIMYGGKERYKQGFGGKPEGRRPLEKPRHRWEGNIKMDLREVEMETQNASMCFRTGEGSGLLWMR